MPLRPVMQLRGLLASILEVDFVCTDGGKRLLSSWLLLQMEYCVLPPPPKFLCWNPVLPCHGIRGRGLWEVTGMRWDHEDGTVESQERACLLPFSIFSTMWGEVCNPEEDPTSLVPQSRAPSLQSYEKYISMVYKPTSLYCAVIATATDEEDHHHLIFIWRATAQGCLLNHFTLAVTWATHKLI